jgi:hypothetical protein
MQFNDLYCLARPQVHTLSCGVARPSDFDEHIARLEHYDRAAEIIAPIEKRGLRAEMERGAGRMTGVSCGSRACRYTSMCRARSMSQRFSGSGPTPNRSTSWLGQDALQPAGTGGPLVSRRERRNAPVN